MKIKKSKSDIIFEFINTLLMLIIIIVTLYPFWYVLVASFSDPSVVIESKGIMLLPKGITFDAYKAVIANKSILTGYVNTIFYVVVGTALNLLFTVILAYGLSRKNIRYSGFFMKAIVFTMFFSGGMIPSYMLIKQLGIMGTVWSILLPGLISTYNLIILRTSFRSVPQSLEESAKIDGANEWNIMWKIVLPLSMPTIAVMILYYGVGRWNDWFNASIYLTERSMFPLQLVLREILVINSMDSMSMSASVQDKVSVEYTIKYATIIVATIPILCIYPFLQKYFIKGVMIGAIKE